MNSEQASIDPFKEMNRYDERHEEYPSGAVYEEPLRRVSTGWRKFHAERDCGFQYVRYVETDSRPIGERYEWNLYCARCGHQVPEEEVLFIGGEWYEDVGWQAIEKTIDDLWLPPQRALDLGPDPDQNEIIREFSLTRIERESTFGLPPTAFDQSAWDSCEDCGHAVPFRFNGACRMCYDGTWTDRMQDVLVSFDRILRVWHNDSHGHKVEKQIDPLHPVDTVSPGRILWRRHAAEPTDKLVEVTQRLEDIDSGHTEYVLWDPTHTNRHQYHEEDLRDCFWDTGLQNEAVKPVVDDRIREVYQRVCDHSFSRVHSENDNGELVPDGEQCLHCRKRREN